VHHADGLPARSALDRALAALELDRRAGLTALAACFSTGRLPVNLNGPCRGRLLATTLAPGLDRLAEGMARVWLPWLGKAFEPDRDGGRNLLTLGGARAVRFALPLYDGLRREGDDRWSAFRFVTTVARSATFADLDVLRIDYCPVEENPSWPIRRILDELVAVDDGVFLGQALYSLRGRYRRAAWFSLEL
jgi:hypothetical protein